MTGTPQEIKPTRGIPTYKRIWQHLDPVQVEMNREDLRMLVFHLGEQKKVQEKVLEILKKTRAGTFTDEDRKDLPPSLRDGTLEQLQEQVNSWIGYVDHFDFYIRHLEEYIGEPPENGDETPDSFDWTKQPVGINGLNTSVPKFIEKKYVLRDVPSRNEHFKDLENGMVFESSQELKSYFNKLLTDQGATVREISMSPRGGIGITWKAKDANIENNTHISFDRI